MIHGERLPEAMWTMARLCFRLIHRMRLRKKAQALLHASMLFQALARGFLARRRGRRLREQRRIMVRQSVSYQSLRLLITLSFPQCLLLRAGWVLLPVAWRSSLPVLRARTARTTNRYLESAWGFLRSYHRPLRLRTGRWTG